MSTLHIGNGLVRISAGMVSILLNSLLNRGEAPRLRCANGMCTDRIHEIAPNRTPAHWPVSGPRSAAAFFALWAVDWLRTDLFPHFGADTFSPAQRQAALFSAFAVVAASVAVARRAEFPRGRRAWACAGIGLGLFVAPSALAACAQG